MSDSIRSPAAQRPGRLEGERLVFCTNEFTQPAQHHIKNINVTVKWYFLCYNDTNITSLCEWLHKPPPNASARFGFIHLPTLEDGRAIATTDRRQNGRKLSLVSNRESAPQYVSARLWSKSLRLRRKILNAVSSITTTTSADRRRPALRDPRLCGVKKLPTTLRAKTQFHDKRKRCPLLKKTP